MGSAARKQISRAVEIYWDIAMTSVLIDDGEDAPDLTRLNGLVWHAYGSDLAFKIRGRRVECVDPEWAVQRFADAPFIRTTADGSGDRFADKVSDAFAFVFESRVLITRITNVFAGLTLRSRSDSRRRIGAAVWGSVGHSLRLAVDVVSELAVALRKDSERAVTRLAIRAGG